MKVNYNPETNKLLIEYEIFDEHFKTLFYAKANEDDSIEFENRDKSIKEDINGNELSWQICDELIDMGLLYENEASFHVCYKLTELGEKVLKSF